MVATVEERGAEDWEGETEETEEQVVEEEAQFCRFWSCGKLMLSQNKGQQIASLYNSKH